MMLGHFETHRPLLLFSYVIQQSNSTQSVPSTITDVLLNSIFFQTQMWNYLFKRVDMEELL